MTFFEPVENDLKVLNLSSNIIEEVSPDDVGQLRRLRCIDISRYDRRSDQITDPIARGFCHRGKLEVAGNEGHKQAGKADRTVVPLLQNPLAIGSVSMPSLLPIFQPPQVYALLNSPSLGTRQQCPRFESQCQEGSPLIYK